MFQKHFQNLEGLFLKPDLFPISAEFGGA